ncbi:MAG: hypothetical protein WD426_10550 [Anditalea sp.]
MKQSLQRTLYFSLFILVSLNFLIGSMLGSQAQNISKRVETGVSFPNNLNSSTVDFKLKSTGEKKIKVILEAKILNNTKVKIYDIVGNLIIEDHIKPSDDSEKSFDFSHVNSKLFVVEVGNSKYNKTKSIYAQPQGKPKKLVDTESQQ